MPKKPSYRSILTTPGQNLRGITKSFKSRVEFDCFSDSVLNFKASRNSSVDAIVTKSFSSSCQQRTKRKTKKKKIQFEDANRGKKNVHLHSSSQHVSTSLQCFSGGCYVLMCLMAFCLMRLMRFDVFRSVYCVRRKIKCKNA